jgi:hypothetical protein
MISILGERNASPPRAPYDHRSKSDNQAHTGAGEDIADEVPIAQDECDEPDAHERKPERALSWIGSAKNHADRYNLDGMAGGKGIDEGALEPVEFVDSILQELVGRGAAKDRLQHELVKSDRRGEAEGGNNRDFLQLPQWATCFSPIGAHQNSNTRACNKNRHPQHRRTKAFRPGKCMDEARDGIINEMDGGPDQKHRAKAEYQAPHMSSAILRIRPTVPVARLGTGANSLYRCRACGFLEMT